MHEIVDKLIEACVKTPQRLAIRYPSHRDDFFSVAAEAIITAVQDGKTDVPLVSKIVKRACIEYVSQIPVIRIPLRSAMRLKAKGMDSMVQSLQYLDNHSSPVEPDEDDVITCICLTARERSIVALRLEGLTQYSIAAQLGVSQYTVSVELKRIKERFNETSIYRHGFCAS